jgi:cell division septation protein DedD
MSGLAGLQPSYEKAGAFTRLRVGPLGSRAAADKVCAQAKAAGQACFPVAP